jgi:hypothetical protein
MLKFETEISQATYYERENLLYVVMKDITEITVEKVIRHNEQTQAAMGERLHKVLHDIRSLQFTHVSREVLSYIADSPQGKYEEFEAYIVNGLGQRILGNFYLKVMKPKTPTKFFSDVEAALGWLEVNKHEIAYSNDEAQPLNMA